MKASVLPAFALVAFAVTQGCNLKLGRGSPPQMLPKAGLNGGKPSETKGASADGYGVKRVYGKQEPANLIARDGTNCGVSKKKYDSTRIGTSVWCIWSDQTH